MDQDDPHPVTIVRARYGGVYEPGPWLTFNAYPAALPPEWDADDLTASAYYDAHSGEVGGGKSPNEAYENLRDLMRKRGGPL